jgi:hypothetical protein
MKRAGLIVCVFALAAVTISSQEKDFPKLTGPYLGQKPPGMLPVHFGAGIIDNDERVFAITFSPDGKECFYTKSFVTNTIMTTKEINGRWTKPAIADFSGKAFDFEPHITPDGKYMIFGSMRTLPSMDKNDELHQWISEKTGDEWSKPKPIDTRTASISSSFDHSAKDSKANRHIFMGSIRASWAIPADSRRQGKWGSGSM